MKFWFFELQHLCRNEKCDLHDFLVFWAFYFSRKFWNQRKHENDRKRENHKMESREKCFSVTVSGFRYRSAHLGLCLPSLFLSFWFWLHFAPFYFLVFGFVFFLLVSCVGSFCRWFTPPLWFGRGALTSCRSLPRRPLPPFPLTKKTLLKWIRKFLLFILNSAQCTVTPAESFLT